MWLLSTWNVASAAEGVNVLFHFNTFKFELKQPHGVGSGACTGQWHSTVLEKGPPVTT